MVSLQGYLCVYTDCTEVGKAEDLPFCIYESLHVRCGYLLGLYICMAVYGYVYGYLHGYLYVFTDYTEVGEDEDLPLGPEFQAYIQCFINTEETQPEERYRPASVLLEQLEWVALTFIVKNVKFATVCEFCQWGVPFYISLACG